MSTGRDLLWQEMLRLWLRLDEAQRREVLKKAERVRDREVLKRRLPDQGGTQ